MSFFNRENHLCSFAAYVYPVADSALPTLFPYQYLLFSCFQQIPPGPALLGANFQSALLFSHPANLAAIFFPQSVILPYAVFQVFFSPSLLRLPSAPSMQDIAWAQSAGVVCAVPLLRFPFCFLHHFFLMPHWIRNNKQRELGKEAEWPCSQK